MASPFYWSMKAYMEMSADPGLELKVDTRVYNMMELFSLCKWKRFYQKVLSSNFVSCS